VSLIQLIDRLMIANFKCQALGANGYHSPHPSSRNCNSEKVDISFPKNPTVLHPGVTAKLSGPLINTAVRCSRKEGMSKVPVAGAG